MDYMALTQHYNTIDEIRDHFQYGKENYNGSQIIDELGGSEISQTLIDIGSNLNQESLPRFLELLFRLKGTTRGIKLILSLVGLNIKIYDHYRVSREIALGTENGQKWAIDPDLNSLEECDILLEIDSPDVDIMDTRVEDQLRKIAEVFFWVCGNVKGFKFGITFSNVATNYDRIESYIDEDWYQPYGINRQKITPKTRIGDIILGEFIIGEDEGDVGGMNKPGEGVWDTFENVDEIELSSELILEGRTDKFFHIGGFTIGQSAVLQSPSAILARSTFEIADVTDFSNRVTSRDTLTIEIED